MLQYKPDLFSLGPVIVVRLLHRFAHELSDANERDESGDEKNEAGDSQHEFGFKAHESGSACANAACQLTGSSPARLYSFNLL